VKVFDSRERLRQVVVSPAVPVAQAMEKLDRAGLGVLLLCREDGTLVAVLTDGDVRRAILRRVPLDRKAEEIAGKDPLTAQVGITPEQALHLMDHGRPFVVNQLPLVNEHRRVMDLWLRSDLVTEKEAGLRAVVMAGGHGKRLHPLTEETPKPMLPLGGRPVMEHIINKLRHAGIEQVKVTTHYKPEKIKQHFGDGRRFGVRIDYVSEEQPLGTAGALGLMETADQPLLVINGDILTDVDVRAMLSFHREHEAAMTVGVRVYDLSVPFGVLECEGPLIRKVSEKPSYKFFVNAGVYLLDPEAQALVPAGKPFDMTDLIEELLAHDRSVISFPILEYWLDMGRPEDYQQAQDDLNNGRWTS
jgi:dTDP-glucose pyrophosphorylase